MELTLQVTMSCHACGEDATPVNAVVDQVECVGCGAILSIRTQGGVLRVGYERTPPCCPHCSTTWTALPDGSCPHCAQPVLRRAPPVQVDGIEQLIAEDRALVMGAEAAGLAGTLGCASCGAPLEVQAERKVQCGSCEAQTVVPDEIWRRSKAPQLTARWLIEVDTDGTDNPLQELGIESMAVGPDGTLFIVGYEHPLEVVAALAPDLSRRLWTHEIEHATRVPVPLPDGRLALVPSDMVGSSARTVQVADADGVGTLFALADGDDIVDGAVQGDTLVLAGGEHVEDVGTVMDLMILDRDGNTLHTLPIAR